MAPSLHIRAVWTYFLVLCAVQLFVLLIFGLSARVGSERPSGLIEEFQNIPREEPSVGETEDEPSLTEIFFARTKPYVPVKVPRPYPPIRLPPIEPIVEDLFVTAPDPPVFQRRADLPEARNQPNIIMISVDDMGYGDFTNPEGDFPTDRLNELANEGLILTNYYAQHLCTPTRAAWMTGRYPYRSGLNRHVIVNGVKMGLPLELETLPSMLKAGGYRTYGVGKWNLGMHQWEYTPRWRGFDDWFGFWNAQEGHFSHRARVGPLSGYDLYRNETPEWREGGIHSSQLFTDRANQILSEELKADKDPLFLYLAYSAPHIPLEAPPVPRKICRELDLHDEDRVGLCSMVIQMDHMIGTVIETIKNSGALNNTIVIFTSDNGGNLASGSRNWPLRGGKFTVWDGGLRVRGFIWAPHLFSGTFDHLFHVTDWLPTIVEGMAGIPVSSLVSYEIDGINQWPKFFDSSQPGRTEALLHFDPPDVHNKVGSIVYRQGKWKLIQGFPNCTRPGRKQRDSELEEVFVPERLQKRGPQHNPWAFNPQKDVEMPEKWHYPHCPDGWLGFDGKWYEPTDMNKDETNLVWLFDLDADPGEWDDVSQQHPDVIQTIQNAMDPYLATPVTQQIPHLDENADPELFGGFWAPWVPSDAPN